MIITPFGEVKLGAFREVLAPPGRYLNDHCLIRHEGIWHFFGIAGRQGGMCDEPDCEISFAHATSSDLVSWQIHPDVLAATGTGPDASHVFAPHVVQEGGTFFLFYTGIDARQRQRICLATSADLFQWTRFAGNPVVVPSAYWALWPGINQPETDVGNCRDNHILRLDDGRFVMYWAARMNARTGPGRGCVAASVSDDLWHWQEVGPVFSMRDWAEHPTHMTESPCVVKKDGQYWLFFKHGWWTYVVSAPTPWDFEFQTPVRVGFAHAAEVFEEEGRWIITHCSADPADYPYRVSNRTRGFFLGELDWPAGGFPRLVGSAS